MNEEETGLTYKTKRCDEKDGEGKQCIWGVEHNRLGGPPHDFQSGYVGVQIVVHPQKTEPPPKSN